MKIPTIIMIWIVFSVLTTLVLFLKNKDVKKEETYIVSSSKVVLIFFAILNIIVIGFTIWFFYYIFKTNQKNDLWYVALLSIIFSFMGFWLFWERLSFKIKVYKDDLIVRSFFMREKKYKFEDLTDYMEYSLYGNGLVSVIDAYINNKCVISTNELDIGYDKLRKDIKKYINKNVQNIKKDITLTAHLPLPILSIILGLVTIYGFFMSFYDFKQYGYVYSAEKFPFKGIELIILLFIIALGFILYGIKHVTSKIYIHEKKVIYKKYFFIKKYYNFKDFSCFVVKDEGGNSVIKIYDRNNKKIVTIPDFYKNKYIFILRAKQYGIKIKEK